jgi:Ni,Fe-hydrogenase III small subunit
MLTLLRDLRRLRSEIGLPRPTRRGSLAIRHVDAGSCNGCEHELSLATSPYYDLARFGLGIVASPRHADVLLVTGVVTTRMREPLLAAYNAMPEPRLVAALGDCALGCGLLGAADDIVGPVELLLPVDSRIPGCPPAPDIIAVALLALLDREVDRGDASTPTRHLPRNIEPGEAGVAGASTATSKWRTPRRQRR